MKAITKYRAEDGSEWTTATEAGARDRLCGEVADAMGPLIARPTDCDYGNGDGFVQQDRTVALAAKQRLLDLAARISSYGVFKLPAEQVHPMGVAGRILDDMGGPISRAWWRFQCMDAEWREWGQPYFAIHGSDKPLRRIA